MQPSGQNRTDGHPAATVQVARSPRGSVAAAHPHATTAAADLLRSGGSAVDAAVAAQAVICVLMPQAAGLGGDVLALVHDGGRVHAVNGTGASPAGLSRPPAMTGGSSVTVPGLVDGWLTLHERWGRLPLATVLSAAIEAAEQPLEIEPSLRAAVRAQRARLESGGAAGWALLQAVDQHDRAVWRQPELAALLHSIAANGRDAFYTGKSAAAIVAATASRGGELIVDDLETNTTPCPDPISVRWASGGAHVQPPSSQGILLAMALQRVRTLLATGIDADDHVLVEVVGAAFAHRSSCHSGHQLLGLPLHVDLHRASGRGGARAYLHTAGVAAADASGLVVSSLVSVFDDFGSGVYVPELGVVLNNRAAGFTDGANAPGPGKRPVHTLAPAMLTDDRGVHALATPGADGQVQTLLQVLARTACGTSLSDAVAALRWRSQDGELLVEQGHPAAEVLTSKGHRVRFRPPGDDVFGAVVAAGTDAETTYAVADWRRQTHARGVE